MHPNIHFRDAWAINRHEQCEEREREHTYRMCVECTRHNINRICQTRKIHQSATHLYNHRSISRHQFIAFAFIVDQTATQSKTGETDRAKVRVCVCVFCVTYWQYCRCLFLRCVRISLCCVWVCVLSYSLVLFRCHPHRRRHRHRHLSMLSLWRQHIQ